MKDLVLLIALSCSIIFLFVACKSDENSAGSETTTFTNKHSDDRMLIVLAAPSVNDDYYAQVFDQIIEFDIQYANTVQGNDNIIVLADKETLPYLKGKLPQDILLPANVADIWLRDFSTVLPSKMVQFSYSPSYLDRSTSAFIQTSFNDFAAEYGLQYKRSNLILDGGNVVDNNRDKIIVTDRILEDNPELTEAEIIAELQAVLGVSQVAIIPQEKDEPMGHADGIVMWVSDNTVLVNTYGQPFRSQVLAALKKGLPGTEIIEIEADYSLEIWRGFISACGINVNSTVSHKFIYVPVFGNENDEAALQKIKSLTDKTVKTINAENVCFMGGSVRCLSWQVTGDNAKKLIEAARKD